MKENIIIEYRETGICKIDINKSVRKISKNRNEWAISQYHKSYRLIRFTPKTKRVTFKITISKKQAYILIGKLNLINEKSAIFRNGSMWESEVKI